MSEPESATSVTVKLSEDMTRISVALIPPPGTGRAVRARLNPQTARWVARVLLEKADDVDVILAEIEESKMTQFNKDQLDEAIAQARAAGEQEEPEQPSTVAVNCTGCGREMKVVETQRVPRSVDPPSGLKVRHLATGQQSWYCSEVCFREHQS